jgi:UDP-3-O-[3-hydroxymyristoyl] glucosamine N-acyltransferase
MKRSVKEIAEFVQGRLIGDGSIEITGIASIDSAATGDLVFIEDEKNLKQAIQSCASAIIASSSAAPITASKPLITCEQPRFAFARAAAFVLPEKKNLPAVHESAMIHPLARIGKNVSIEAHVSIDESAEVGDGTCVGAGSRLGKGVRIGEGCSLAPNVTIYPGVRLGNRVIVHAGAVLGSDGFGYVRDARTGSYTKFPQIGRLEIEDDVEIGANSTIDRGALDVTRIARGTKIDNLVHIGHNVQIGEDVVIAAQTGLSGSAVLEDGVVVAGQVGIADHVRIESGAILGAQCGVPTKKVIRGKGVVFWGTPARPIREYLKELAVLARLAKRG